MSKCVSGKQIYPSPQAAWVAAASLSKRKRNVRQAAIPYKCPTCKEWHITSQHDGVEPLPYGWWKNKRNGH